MATRTHRFLSVIQVLLMLLVVGLAASGFMQMNEGEVTWSGWLARVSFALIIVSLFQIRRKQR